MSCQVELQPKFVTEPSESASSSEAAHGVAETDADLRPESFPNNISLLLLTLKSCSVNPHLISCDSAPVITVVSILCKASVMSVTPSSLFTSHFSPTPFIYHSVCGHFRRSYMLVCEFKERVCVCTIVCVCVCVSVKERA